MGGTEPALTWADTSRPRQTLASSRSSWAAPHSCSTAIQVARTGLQIKWEIGESLAEAG